MKKILLLSDTHGYLDDKIIKYVNESDEVWHAGDIGKKEILNSLSETKPLKAVYGNIDGAAARIEFPLHQKFTVEGLKVWITHIGGYPNRYSKPIRDVIKFERPDLFISGHSHILKVMQDKKLNLLHMNPGAVGKHGFHKLRTMLRFKISKGEIKELEIVEFKR